VHRPTTTSLDTSRNSKMPFTLDASNVSLGVAVLNLKATFVKPIVHSIGGSRL
jgi:hypothetical protein